MRFESKSYLRYIIGGWGGKKVKILCSIWFYLFNVNWDKYIGVCIEYFGSYGRNEC